MTTSIVRTPLVVKTSVERTAGGSLGPEPSKLPVDMTLTFGPGERLPNGSQSGAQVKITFGQRLQESGLPPHLDLPIKLNLATLAGQVAMCRARWATAVVKATEINDAKYGSIAPFYKYHVSIEHDLDAFFKGVLRELAHAGQVLYAELFCPKGECYERTAEFGEQLKGLLRDRVGLRIVVSSEDFLLPWNFIHLGSRRDTEAKDFVGARHIVELDVATSAMDSGAIPPPASVSFQFDQRMDSEKDTRVHQAVADFRDLVNRYGLRRVDRETKSDFLDALADGVDESLFYFMCHGRAGDDRVPNSEPTQLYLTQDSVAKGNEPKGIAPAEVGTCLSESGELKGRPLVFINSCHALKSGSIYYTGFATRFLEWSARAVVGPEIEMPVLFAREFARRFFEELFKGGEERTVGQVLLALRRNLLFEHANPLGLAYTLYRGGDHYLATAVVDVGPMMSAGAGRTR